MCRKIFLLLLLFYSVPVQAQGLSLIRDEEIERTLYSYLRPLFDKAGLDSKSMSIHLVKEDTINAFAAKGLHVFIHTGLLLKADNAQEVIAVLAHETGHVSGGHIVRLYENMRIAQRNMLLSMLLGSVAAAASGRGDVGMAVAMGGFSSTQGLLAGYRQTEENAADQVAVDLLERTGHDLSGFEGIMKKLQQQESYQIGENDILWRTHPKVKERLAFILAQKKEDNEERSSVNRKRIERENIQFERVQAKLHAFLYSPERTYERYPEKDASVPARYARAIAAYRQGRFQASIRQMDVLIKEFPNDPYFHEFKGQVLFETGNAAEAVPSYQKAVSLLPDSVLFRLGLGQAQIEAEGAENLSAAVQNLEFASKEGNEIPLIWRFLAVAYGRSGNIPMASYALAEYNFLVGNEKQAENFARKAVASLPAGSVAMIQAEDILENLRNSKNRKRDVQ